MSPTPRRRRIPSPRSPSLPRVPPIRLAPIRSRESVALDDRRTTKKGLPYPPFMRFDEFMDKWSWRQGQHVTTIGPVGSGKTVLNRQLLHRRDYVVVLGVKNRDPELYGPFEQEGYQLVHKFEPEPPDQALEAKVLFVPQSQAHGVESRQQRSRAFRQVLNDVYDVGYWCVYVDDVQYVADKLKLAPELEELWLLGRSEGVSVVVSSQEPVDIPVMAYGQASHLFLFANRDLYRARRMAELTGVNREITEEVILTLPPHEFLYISKDTGTMIRSMVMR